MTAEATPVRAATARGSQIAIPAISESLSVPAPSALLLLMLFISALPDAMVAPALDGLIVRRYGVDLAAAHWFMAVNLIGAAAAMPLIAMLRSRSSPAILLACGAALNAVLLTTMALPIGFVATLFVRVAEGAADVVVLAVLFDLIGKSGGGKTHGRRFGLAGTVMMMGIASGLALGGQAGALEPTAALWLGALGCASIAVAGLIKRRRIDSFVQHCPVVEFALPQDFIARSQAGSLAEGSTIATEEVAGIVAANRAALRSSLVMAFSDRALAGIMATTVPLHLTAAGHGSGRAGGVLAAAMLVMALGAAPAGLIADRFGLRGVRAAAALLFASLMAGIPLCVRLSPVMMVMLMLGIGVAGAALLPTSAALAMRGGRGSVGMAGYHAAGSLGFFLGIAGAATLLHLLQPRVSEQISTGAIILIFAAAHGLCTLFLHLRSTILATSGSVAGQSPESAYPPSVH